MTAGVLIYNDSGYIQITEQFANFVLLTKGTVNLDGTAWTNSSGGGTWVCGSHAQISVANSSGFPPLIAIQCATEVIVFGANLVGANWVFDIVSVYGTAHTDTITWYAFGPTPNVIPANYGLEVFKADGTLAFHSTYGPIRITAALTAAGTTTMTAGRSCALLMAQTSITCSGELPIGPNWSRSWNGTNIKTSSNTGTVNQFQYCLSTNTVHFGTPGVTSGAVVVLAIDVTNY